MSTNDAVQRHCKYLAANEPWKVSIEPLDDLGMGPPVLNIFKKWLILINLRLWRPFYLYIAFPTRMRYIKFVAACGEGMRYPALIELGAVNIDMDIMARLRAATRANRAANRRKKVANFIKNLLAFIKVG